MREQITFFIATCTVCICGFASLYYDNDARMMYYLMMGFCVLILSMIHRNDGMKKKSTFYEYITVVQLMGLFFLANS